MGIFDKIIRKFKKTTKKAKVKLIMGSTKDDGQEKFLKPDEPMMIKIGEEKEPMIITVDTKAPEKKASPRKSSVTKVEVKSAAAKSPEKKASSSVKIAEKPKQNAMDKKSAPDDDSYTRGAVTVTEGKNTRNGKFDIQRAKDGRFFFNLYASNHTVIAYSQIYSSTAAAMNGINSIIANASKSPIEDTTLKNPTSSPCPKWEIYIDKAGEYRFRLYATNGLQICHSAHGYSTKSGCKGGIDSIGRFASDAAKIDKSYLK